MKSPAHKARLFCLGTACYWLDVGFHKILVCGALYHKYLDKVSEIIHVASLLVTTAYLIIYSYFLPSMQG